ncbi:MAG: DUF2259 domain-containing protein [Treponema sp.]|nr:DUF2259 domain-containing protein [Treponema sp.]
MLSKKTFLVIAGMLLLNTFTLRAGDSATFVDLGFSSNGGIYMFAQYGVQSGTLKPWADIFVVDVERNNFVSGGRVSYVHDSPILSGQDGSGALYQLIAQNVALANRWGISFPNQGQPLFIALEESPVPRGETIEFRDFVSGIQYRASLVSSVEGSGSNLRSSFYIDLQSSPRNGPEKRYTVGTPQLKRSQIDSYRIKKVLIAPPGNALIFVIEMKRQGADGPDIRYMIEALQL